MQFSSTRFSTEINISIKKSRHSFLIVQPLQNSDTFKGTPALPLCEQGFLSFLSATMTLEIPEPQTNINLAINLSLIIKIQHCKSA
jgi:hypothetical protein